MKNELKAELVYQLKVTLRGTKPPIWRRLQVRKEITLAQLHGDIQRVMGWTGCHLHQFRVGNTFYGPHDPDLEFEGENENNAILGKVLRRPKARMEYEYDFGDSWRHDVVLESVVPSTPGQRYPLVLAGKRRCPPEDVGGVGGYYRFLHAIQDPSHPDHREMMEWWSDGFDPELFDVQEVNRAFHGSWRPRKP